MRVWGKGADEDGRKHAEGSKRDISFSRKRKWPIMLRRGQGGALGGASGDQGVGQWHRRSGWQQIEYPEG